MQNNKGSKRPVLTEEQRLLRKKYIGATFVTCIVLSLVGGTFHVLTLGSNRMDQMRNAAMIDLEKEDEHLRAAGEELYRDIAHEHRQTHNSTYSSEEALGLLAKGEWQELNKMIEIPAGQFLMGTDSLKADIQNRPEHVVNLPAFQIDKYPVTNAQYAVFVADTDHRPPLHWTTGKFNPGIETHPVTMVTWFDARDYCAWANKRLPTEQEWEKAARGTEGRRWPWGEKMDSALLNTYYTVGSTTTVFKYKGGVSPYGVYDMAGNVSEWVGAEFNPYKNSEAPEDIFKAKAPKLPDSKEEERMSVVDFVTTDMKYKVLRGGSWKSDPFSTSAYHRNYQWPQLTTDFYGFRCAKDVDVANKTTEVIENVSPTG